jgi:putative spermidine/putrescine transport system ATP-binding protein
MSERGFLSIEGLRLSYGPTIVVPSLDLELARGELVALLGPSGCGKTTTMRAIAGLTKPLGGRIRLEGEDITKVPANKRGVGLVFQSYALFPHLTVFENVAFGPSLRKHSRDEIARSVADALTTVGLLGLERRLPREISGGQQQRVALARAIVVEPRLLLLDEPLSNLDARLRLEMRSELKALQRKLDMTMLYVTHDQAEALALADRVVVMRAGRIDEIADAETIYNHPKSAFTARFMGFENIFAVRDGMLTGTDGQRLPHRGNPNAKALAWRPGGVAVGKGPFTARVLGAAFAGAKLEYLLDTPIGHIKAEVDAHHPRFQTGQEVAFDLPAEAAIALEDAN